MASATTGRVYKLSAEKRMYHAQHYHKHKAKINELKQEKHECSICNGKFTTGHRKQHELSKKHQLALKIMSTADIILTAPRDRIQSLPLSLLLPVEQYDEALSG
eukprot:51506-Eustigmatos_ZCMA.PRE.1